MLGVAGRPETDGQKIRPLTRFGVKLMSLGFLLDDPKAAVVWRGPMHHGALMQFVADVDWGDLDFLLLDMPPGTGDVALTISQKLKVNGSVVVTTPQEVALMDVYKSVSMNNKVGIPITGVIENESYFVCEGCDKRHELFGSGGGAKIAEMAGAPLFGQLPLDPSVRHWGDSGVPVVQAAPNSSIALEMMGIADRFVAELNRAAGGSEGGLTIDRSGGVNRHLPITRS
jgi:ATP-binding protein involved in chromosome partitioning